MSDNGYNPMRWDCGQADNCWNRIKRPRIEVFAECFPRRISFGDVDGPCARTSIVEINSRALIMEWKDSPGDVPTGQDMMYRNLSRLGFFVAAVVAGNPRSMEVTHYGLYIDGEFTGWRPTTLDFLKRLFLRWAARAEKLGPVVLRKPSKDEAFSEHAEWIADYEKHQHEFDELRGIRFAHG